MSDSRISKAADRRMSAVFNAWRKRGIRACVWKSADRWQEGLQGGTDFDLLVDGERLQEAQQILLDAGWFPVRAESWRTFPGLYDYVILCDGLNHHIHLHAQIVSGDKLVKSLRPPLADLYLNLASPEYPPFVQAELEFVLYVLRMVVKINWIDRLGALKRGSAFSIYRNYLHEFELLRQASDSRILAELLEQPALAGLPQAILAAAHGDLHDIGWRQRRTLKKAIRDWRMPKGIAAGYAKFVRQQARRREGVGKTCGFTAPVIAVCGADGSGKSTLVAALERHLRRHLKVAVFYMGSNLQEGAGWRRVLRPVLWWPYLALRKACKILRWPRAQHWIEHRYRLVEEAMVRRQKRDRLAAAKVRSAAGAIVICERYPLFQPYGDDHEPALLGAEAALPDILVLLDVSAEAALKRRAEDPPEVIRAKVKAFGNLPNTLEDDDVRLVVCAQDSSVDERVWQIAEVLDELCVRRAREVLRA